VHAVEALVRWEHPERGLLAPGEFLPLAEHTGMIRPLTRYVMDAALADCAGWAQEGLRPGVSVNLSARDLLDADLPREVESLLSKHGVDPTLLEVEITEHTILTDPERARIVLERLRELGVRLSIDDFGTGFSSLGQLKRLPVDILKIDRSFVLNMEHDDNDDVIVRSTIDLAQGFFISRPLPRVVLVEWLKKRGSEEPPRRMRLVG